MNRSETSELGSGDIRAGPPGTASVGTRLVSLECMDRSALQDWLRVHRRLVELEIEFSEVIMRAAAGEINANELQEKRNHLLGMRELCTTVYAKAFGSE